MKDWFLRTFFTNERDRIYVIHSQPKSVTQKDIRSKCLGVWQPTAEKK